MCFNSKLLKVHYYDRYSCTYVYRYVNVKCGRCASCISERARINSDDIINELPYYKHGEYGAFVTLTYARPSSPDLFNYKCGFTYDPISLRPTLDKQHIIDFKKRLRRRFSYHLGLKLKIFMSSEYGLKSNNNPHYHFIILGLNPRIPEHVAFIKSCWNYGHVDVKFVSDKSIRYCTSYMSKSHDFKTGRINKSDLFEYDIYKLTALLEVKLFDYLNDLFPHRDINFNDLLFSRKLVESIYYFGYSAIEDIFLKDFYNYYFIPYCKSMKLLKNNGSFRFRYVDFYNWKYGRALEFRSKSPNFGKSWILDNYDLLIQSDHIFTRREKRYLLKYNPDLLDEIEEHNYKLIKERAKNNFYDYLETYNINVSDLKLKDDIILYSDIDKYNIYLYSNFDSIIFNERLELEKSFRDCHKEYIYKLQLKRSNIPIPAVA